MSDEMKERIDQVVETAQQLERLTIASWLTARAGRMLSVDPTCAMELSVVANAIRQNKMGARGMHADEPKLQFRKGKDKLEGLLGKGDGE